MKLKLKEGKTGRLGFKEIHFLFVDRAILPIAKMAPRIVQVGFLGSIFHPTVLAIADGILTRIPTAMINEEFSANNYEVL